MFSISRARPDLVHSPKVLLSFINFLCFLDTLAALLRAAFLFFKSKYNYFNLEDSHSGLVRSPGKTVGQKWPREFESLILRQD